MIILEMRNWISHIMRALDSPSYLFVYGTLRRRSKSKMHRLLERNASFVGEGSVPGKLYSLGHYPALVPTQTTRSTVKGDIYKIGAGKLDLLLAMLDEYEGCSDDDAEPHEYRRAKLEVSIDRGDTVSAWAYVLNRSPEGLNLIDSGDFLKSRAS